MQNSRRASSPRTCVPSSWLPMSRHGTLTCAFIGLGRLALVTGIRRLFLPNVGTRDSVKHLFEEFQNSLWDRRENCQDVPQERRASDHSRLHELAPGARKRTEFLSGKPELQREVLCELLSEQSCAEWLGFNDLDRPDT